MFVCLTGPETNVDVDCFVTLNKIAPAAADEPYSPLHPWSREQTALSCRTAADATKPGAVHS
eukprot:4735199-Pleurochrysis_carterae.AAC.1